MNFQGGHNNATTGRSGEWYPENRGSPQIFCLISESQQRFYRVSEACFFLVWFRNRPGLGFSNKGLSVSASLGFYHSPPLLEYFPDLTTKLHHLTFPWQVNQPVGNELSFLHSILDIYSPHQCTLLSMGAGAKFTLSTKQALDCKKKTLQTLSPHFSDSSVPHRSEFVRCTATVCCILVSIFQKQHRSQSWFSVNTDPVLPLEYWLPQPHTFCRPHFSVSAYFTHPGGAFEHSWRSLKLYFSPNPILLQELPASLWKVCESPWIFHTGLFSEGLWSVAAVSLLEGDMGLNFVWLILSPEPLQL